MLSSFTHYIGYTAIVFISKLLNICIKQNKNYIFLQSGILSTFKNNREKPNKKLGKKEFLRKLLWWKLQMWAKLKKITNKICWFEQFCWKLQIWEKLKEIIDVGKFGQKNVWAILTKITDRKKIWENIFKHIWWKLQIWANLFLLNCPIE